VLAAVGAVAVYAVCTVYLTWPLVTDLGSTVYLFPKVPPGPGDLAGSIADLHQLIEGHHNPFAPGRIEDFNAPNGLEIRWALNIASFPSTLLLFALGLAFGATAAYGLFVMLGYVGSGLAMFLLTRKLTDNAWIALIVGWAFAFYPFPVVKGEHLHFVHGWVFVLMAWRLLELMAKPTLRHGLWAGAVSVLAMAWTQYFILLGGICYATLTFSALTLAAAAGQFRRHLIAHLPSLALVLGFGLVTRGLLYSSGENATLPANTLADVVATSAHLPMFVVPPAHNLLLGDLTAPYLTERGWNGVEWTLYVGTSIILLALIGVGAAIGRRLPPEAVRTALVFLAVVVAGIVFSLPPQKEIRGHVVRLPSYLVYEAASGWRLYTRFVIVVMLGLCILAALGLQALSHGRTPRTRAVLLALTTVIVPLDLWDRPPVATFRIETPPIYSTLRALPAGIVAEYPLRPVLNALDYLDLYFQQAHGKPILNGYFSGPFEQRALELSRLDAPPTAGRLATLGVRYVLLTPGRIRPGVPPPGKPTHGFVEVARDDYGSLFRVTARPVPFVYARAGVEPPEITPKGRSQWVSASTAQLEVDAPCDPCRGVLRFTAASFDRPRLLRLEAEGGKRLGLAVIVTRDTPVSVPLGFRRRLVVNLVTNPGPQSIQKTTGAPDPRSVSIFIKNPRFEESPSRR
jgi:hypothetical protein